MFWDKNEKVDKEKDAYIHGWQVGFSEGMLKSWDLLIPLMSENMDKLKQKLKDDAILEAVKRLNATDKK